MRQVGHHPQTPSVPCRGQARGAQAQFHLSRPTALIPGRDPVAISLRDTMYTERMTMSTWKGLEE